MTAAPTLSVLIVNYRSRELLAACLEGVRRHTSGVDYEVLVLDNSSEGVAELLSERFPWATYVQNDRNLGFAGGNNELARHARGDYVLLLNPDTVVRDNALGELVAFAKGHPHAAAWGGLCELPDGRPDPACFQRVPSLLRSLGNAVFVGRRWFPGRERLAPGVWRVPIITGAFLLTTRERWAAVGGFDVTFFMYNEDVDLCLRLGAGGEPLLFTDRVRIVHIGGGGRRKDPRRILQMVTGRMHLLRKHRHPVVASLQGVCTWLYHAERFVAGCVLGPAIGGERARALRFAHGPTAKRPASWWRGWAGVPAGGVGNAERRLA